MINYNILNTAINYYSQEGFKRIETPWTVSEYVDRITKPEGRVSMQLKHNNKCLVASGEQSFLYLYLKDFIPKGKFQTTTPCFRDENFDLTHTKYFMKCELINTQTVTPIELEKMVGLSLNFFRKYLSNPVVVETQEGYDIECGVLNSGVTA